MALSKESVALAQDLIDLKNRVNIELTRRGNDKSTGSLSSFVSEFTEIPSINTPAKATQISEIINPLNQINDTGYTSIKQEDKILELQTMVDAKLTYWESKSETSDVNNHGCRVSCSGLCYGNCYTACSSCSGTCDSGCYTTCKGTCDSGCYTTCKGTCDSGCYTTCKGGCDSGCYTTCKGDCKGDCSTMCADGCSNDCTGGCRGTCGGCDGTCKALCANSCFTGNYLS